MILTSSFILSFLALFLAFFLLRAVDGPLDSLSRWSDSNTNFSSLSSVSSGLSSADWNFPRGGLSVYLVCPIPHPCQLTASRRIVVAQRGFSEQTLTMQLYPLEVRIVFLPNLAAMLPRLPSPSPAPSSQTNTTHFPALSAALISGAFSSAGLRVRGPS
ncbi:hypothetical protein F5Y15DRAFT_217676 [Xylariaceae sp. FL0016]|nr:hypothetical protein F5Y15DRAFT_217676 [Xylariaceae sp. FL0016]